MKKILALTAALGLVAGSALAVPYASQIRVSTTFAPLDGDITISYVLNQAADDVTVEIIDTLDGDAVVATLVGGTDQGLNQVVWDLTDDSDNPIGEAEGLSVRITVDADRPAGWEVTAANTSTDLAPGFFTTGAFGDVNHNSLFGRVRPHSVFIPKDPTRDDFGIIAVPSSDATGQTTPHGAVLRLRTDLSTFQGNGLEDRVLRHSQTDAGTRPMTFQDVWYGLEDPLNPGSYFVSGQANSTIAAPAGGARTNLSYGTLSDVVSTTAIEIDGNGAPVIDLQGPRTIAVVTDGTDRTLLTARGTGIIERFEIGPDNMLVNAATVNVLGTGVAGTGYSKALFVDSEGNLHWTGRDSFYYRWPASLVTPGIGAGALTAANADWVVTGPGITGAQEIAETADGDIILVTTGTATGQVVRFYNLGNVSSASGPGTLETTDAFFELNAGVDWTNNYAAGMDVDAFGNIYFANANSLFGAFVISPGGETSTTVTAPTSQVFEIGLEPTAVDNTWNMYQ